MPSACGGANLSRSALISANFPFVKSKPGGRVVVKLNSVSVHRRPDSTISLLKLPLTTGLLSANDEVSCIGDDLFFSGFL
jgi:hypothetical protein